MVKAKNPGFQRHVDMRTHGKPCHISVNQQSLCRTLLFHTEVKHNVNHAVPQNVIVADTLTRTNSIANNPALQFML